MTQDDFPLDANGPAYTTPHRFHPTKVRRSRRRE